MQIILFVSSCILFSEHIDFALLSKEFNKSLLTKLMLIIYFFEVRACEAKTVGETLKIVKLKILLFLKK